MKISIPTNRSHVLMLLSACWAVFRGRQAILDFDCASAKVNGIDDPMWISKETAKALEVRVVQNGLLMEKVEALTDLVELALEVIPAETPAGQKLVDGLKEVSKPKTLH